MSKPGWGVIISGEAADLDDWRLALHEHSDPWVEEIQGGDTVLRSSLLDELSSASDVRDRASLIERLNGAVALAENAARPVRFGGVIQFTPDGRQQKNLFLEMAAVERDRDKFYAHVITTSGPDGKPVPPPPPQPSEVQQWARIAEDDELLDDALIYFGRTRAVPRGGTEAEATDWFDIYKALERLFVKFGGWHDFLKLNWVPEAEVELLKRTANWARHAKHKGNLPPPNPMDFSAARTLLGQLLRLALSEAGRTGDATA